MKLYTEEEILSLLKIHLADEDQAESFVELLTPIELPSDEEIRKIMELDDMEFDEFDPYHVSHLDGAIWLRDKIQGGKK